MPQNKYINNPWQLRSGDIVQFTTDNSRYFMVMQVSRKAYNPNESMVYLRDLTDDQTYEGWYFIDSLVKIDKGKFKYETQNLTSQVA